MTEAQKKYKEAFREGKTLEAFKNFRKQAYAWRNITTERGCVSALYFYDDSMWIGGVFYDSYSDAEKDIPFLSDALLRALWKDEGCCHTQLTDLVMAYQNYCISEGYPEGGLACDLHLGLFTHRVWGVPPNTTPVPGTLCVARIPANEVSLRFRYFPSWDENEFYSILTEDGKKWLRY